MNDRKAKPVMPAGNHLGMLETTRVIRDAIPLTFGSDGYTSLGGMIDEHIVNELRQGNELQSLTLHLAEESRLALTQFYLACEQ